MRRDQWPT